MSLVSREMAFIKKANEALSGPHSTSFAGDTIFIWDPQATVVEGDVIIRILPNGTEEQSVVAKATFFSGNVKGPHFQVKWRRPTNVNPIQHKPAQHINIHGAQAIQIGDHNTQSFATTFSSLVEQIEGSNVDETKKEEAKSLVRQLIENPLVAAVIGAGASAIFK